MAKNNKQEYDILTNEVREFVNKLTGKNNELISTLDKKRVSMKLYHHYMELNKQNKIDSDNEPLQRVTKKVPVATSTTESEE